jgi:hypothetical protein
MSVQRQSRLVVQTLNSAALLPAHAPSGSSRIVINNVGQKRKRAQTITPIQTASLAGCRPAESELLTIAPFSEGAPGDIPLDMFEDACPEPMLADALDDDLILSSSLLPASDTYTRTSYWDALVAADAVFRISVDLWVLQGWDGDKETLQVGS